MNLSRALSEQRGCLLGSLKQAQATMRDAPLKSTVICLLGAAVLLAFWPTECGAALDELEDLLSMDFTPSPDSLPPSSLLESDRVAPALAPFPTGAYDDRGWYSPTPSTVSPQEPSVTTEASGQEQKPVHAAPINVVPEPSAWLLAVAALLYFVVFGRRRRLV